VWQHPTHLVLRHDHDGNTTADNAASGGWPPDDDDLYIGIIPSGGCRPKAPAGSTFNATVTKYSPTAPPSTGHARALSVL